MTETNNAKTAFTIDEAEYFVEDLSDENKTDSLSDYKERKEKYGMFISFKQSIATKKSQIDIIANIASTCRIHDTKEMKSTQLM